MNKVQLKTIKEIKDKSKTEDITTFESYKKRKLLIERIKLIISIFVMVTLWLFAFISFILWSSKLIFTVAAIILMTLISFGIILLVFEDYKHFKFVLRGINNVS